jgi:hypothetical protein
MDLRDLLVLRLQVGAVGLDGLRVDRIYRAAIDGGCEAMTGATWVLPVMDALHRERRRCHGG